MALTPAPFSRSATSAVPRFVSQIAWFTPSAMELTGSSPALALTTTSTPAGAAFAAGGPPTCVAAARANTSSAAGRDRLMAVLVDGDVWERSQPDFASPFCQRRMSRCGSFCFHRQGDVMKRIGAVAVLAGLFAFPATASAATTCTAGVLPTPPDTVAYSVTGTDGHGTFVGVVQGAQRQEGVVWRDGDATLLPDFVPLDINESGLMGGYTPGPSNGRVIAALRPLDGPVRKLDASWTTAVNGVNDAGDAVGDVYLEHPVVHVSALWRTPDYRLDGLYRSNASPKAIDDTGLVIGRLDFPDTSFMVWSATTREIIREYGPEVQLYDVDNGVIAASHNRKIVKIDGWTGAETVIAGSARRAAMLWRDGEAILLPAPADTTTREASAVNATGTEAAGISVSTTGKVVPTLWECSAA